MPERIGCITHGVASTPKSNWFESVAKQMRQTMDFGRVYKPQYPTIPPPHKQWNELEHYDEWHDKHAQVIGKNMERRLSAWIGHSLGGTFVLRTLSDGLRNTNHVIRYVCTVQSTAGHRPIGGGYNGNIETFTDGGDFNWGNIRKHAGFIDVITASNDEYIDPAEAEYIAKNTFLHGQNSLDRRSSKHVVAENHRGRLTILPEGGHLGEGMKHFPYLCNAMRSVLVQPTSLNDVHREGDEKFRFLQLNRYFDDILEAAISIVAGFHLYPLNLNEVIRAIADSALSFIVASQKCSESSGFASRTSSGSYERQVSRGIHFVETHYRQVQEELHSREGRPGDLVSGYRSEQSRSRTGQGYGGTGGNW